ncbi:serine/threonine-protein kinase [Nocardia jiangsuensis]|uniref:non-specific serine/threonine protein kinase n=1 Tax=Nocardia jiangsuensis TaxID=1691563 RepID=A0ABV8DVE4_9NOCA
MTEAGERWFGEYRLDREVGRGGMGRVWKAWHAPTERFVALKLLPAAAADDEEYRRRFEREARVAARLSDPHVVAIHSFGRVGDQLYIDMALIDGDDLAALLIDGGRIAPERAVHLLGQVASAVDAAHAAGLVHRDIKPGNVLVSRNDFAYLIDFGIARPRDGTVLTTGSVAIGTIAYMAPERFDGEATARSDIYSLGCVLVECLTGRRAFPGDSHAEQINAHLNHAPPRPSALVADVPPALDRVIAKALAKQPEERFGSAGEFALAAWAALEADAGPLSEPIAVVQSVSPSPVSAESGAERLVVRGVATPVLGAADETESHARGAKLEVGAAKTPPLPDDPDFPAGLPLAADSPVAVTPALPAVDGEAAEPAPVAAETPVLPNEPQVVVKLPAAANGAWNPAPDPPVLADDAPPPARAVGIAPDSPAEPGPPTAAVDGDSSSAAAKVVLPAGVDEADPFAEPPAGAAAKAVRPAVVDGDADSAGEPSEDAVVEPAGVEPESERRIAEEPTPVPPEPGSAPPAGRGRVTLRDPILIAPKPALPKPLPVRAAAAVLGVLGAGVLTTTLLLAAPDGPSEEAGTAPTSVLGPAITSPGRQSPGVAAPPPNTAPTSGAPAAVEVPGARTEPVLAPPPAGEVPAPAPPVDALRPPLPSIPVGAPITSQPEPTPPTTVPQPTTTVPATTPQPTTEPPPTTPSTTAPATTTATEPTPTSTQPSLPTQPAAAPIEPAPGPFTEPSGPAPTQPSLPTQPAAAPIEPASGPVAEAGTAASAQQSLPAEPAGGSVAEPSAPAPGPVVTTAPETPARAETR